MSKTIYGLSRSRDKHGNIVKRNLNDVVNCIHTNAVRAVGRERTEEEKLRRHHLCDERQFSSRVL